MYTCQHCGKSFVSKKNVAYFCSIECSKAAVKAGWKSPVTLERQAAAEKAKVRVELTCAECGNKFIKVYKDKIAAMQEQQMNIKQYCSDSCRKTSWNKEREYLKSLKKASSPKQTSPTKSLCASCKTCYKDCERMQSNFRISPKGARYNNNGVLIECPKYTRG